MGGLSFVGSYSAALGPACPPARATTARYAPTVGQVSDLLIRSRHSATTAERPETHPPAQACSAYTP